MEYLIEALDKSIDAGNWYAALVVALTLPDIAGWVEDPKASSQSRYSDWFDRFVSPKYRRVIGNKPHQFLTGSDCYALRCSLLHEGREEISHQRARRVLERFQFVAPRPGRTLHCNQVDSKLQLQVDRFCADIRDGMRSWHKGIAGRNARLLELITIDDKDDIHV